MERAIEHHCLPRAAQPCLQCGEMLPTVTYCAICGADITPRHTCAPRPLEHTCPPMPPPVRCLQCGELLPAALFCTTCGADITPRHRCKAAPLTAVPRPDPLHRCPAYALERCDRCGGLLPGRTYCSRCGMDITPPHVCPPAEQPHVCPPYLTIPRRCPHCGEYLPAPRHCPQCGADITPLHVCG